MGEEQREVYKEEKISKSESPYLQEDLDQALSESSTKLMDEYNNEVLAAKLRDAELSQPVDLMGTRSSNGGASGSGQAVSAGPQSSGAHRQKWALRAGAQLSDADLEDHARKVENLLEDIWSAERKKWRSANEKDVGVESQSTSPFQSLMVRLIEMARLKPLMLVEQRRMHSNIARFPNKQFYEGKLQNYWEHPDTDTCLESGVLNQKPDLDPPQWDYGKFLCWKYKVRPSEVPGEKRSILIVHCANGLEAQVGQSKMNDYERDLLIELLIEFFNERSNRKLKVGVVTPYKTQKMKLEDAVREKQGQIKGEVSVDTIDGCQGMERDVIFVSTVRCNGQGRVGFLADARRMNVMITRARRQIVFVTNLITISQCAELEKRNRAKSDNKQQSTPRSFTTGEVAWQKWAREYVDTALLLEEEDKIKIKRAYDEYWKVSESPESPP